jgi:hypothetical protein
MCVAILQHSASHARQGIPITPNSGLGSSAAPQYLRREAERGSHDTNCYGLRQSVRSAIAGKQKVREGLHGGEANGIGGGADVIGKKPVGFGEGHLSAQSIVSVLQ